MEIANTGDLMPDNKQKTGPQDSLRINTGEAYEVRYWTEKFGVTAEKLKEAVKVVDSSASS